MSLVPTCLLVPLVGRRCRAVGVVGVQAGLLLIPGGDAGLVGEEMEKVVSQGDFLILVFNERMMLAFLIERDSININTTDEVGPKDDL